MRRRQLRSDMRHRTHPGSHAPAGNLVGKWPRPGAIRAPGFQLVNTDDEADARSHLRRESSLTGDCVPRCSCLRRLESLNAGVNSLVPAFFIAHDGEVTVERRIGRGPALAVRCRCRCYAARRLHLKLWGFLRWPGNTAGRETAGLTAAGAETSLGSALDGRNPADSRRCAHSRL